MEDKNIDKIDSSVLFLQARLVFYVSFLCLTCGTFIGYTSSAIPSIQDEFINITQNDVSWIGGAGPLGAIFGALSTIFLIKYIGARDAILYFGGPIFITSWLLIITSKMISQIICSRFLGGVATGIIISCSPLYVISVASPQNRGRLGALSQQLMLAGILISYGIGTESSYKFHATICGVISLIYLTFLPFINKALTKNQSHAGTSIAVISTIAQHSSKNIENITESENNVTDVSLELKTDQCMPQKISIFKAVNLKAFATCVALMSFQQLSGINAVSFYALSIFERGNFVIFSSKISPILLASTQMIASFSASFLIDRFGRKILLLISSGICAFCSLALTTYFYFYESKYDHEWALLVALILYSFGFAIGFGPVTWILVSELLPVEVRDTVNPMLSAYNWLVVFGVTKTYPMITSNLTICTAFGLYGIFSAIGFTFFMFCLPETKGKSLRELENLFK